MIAITKAEKEVIREQFPNVHIVRTMKQKSKRHRYYCVEDRRVMRLLDRMRNPNAGNDSKGGARNTRKKAKRNSYRTPKETGVRKAER